MSSEKIKKVGFTCSSFDLFHAGHVEMLRDAKSQCDYLIVGLQTDPTIDRPEKNKPIQSVSERYIQVRACCYVDEVIPYTTEDELLELMKLVNPNVRILGDEYRHKNFTGKDFCLDNDVQIYYNKRMHKYSSSELRNRISENNETKR